MSDLEERLRETLDRRAEEGARSAPTRMPGNVARASRRRQARSVLIGTLVVAAVASGAVLSARTLIDPTDPRPGAAGPGPGEDVRHAEAELARAVVTSGERDGYRWQLIVEKRGNEWCVIVEAEEGPIAGCGFDVPPQNLSVAPHFGAGFLIFVTGAVSGAVASVHLETETGRRIEGQVLEPPEEMGVPFNAFVIVLVGPTPGTVIAEDENGSAIASEPGPPRPSPPSGPPTFAPGDLVGAADHYGNSVGFISFSDLSAPPPPPGSDQEQASWSPPGLRLSVQETRRVALQDLKLVWVEVAGWWASRPAPGDSEDAFQRWWSSYPVGETRDQPRGEDVVDIYENVWAKIDERRAGPKPGASPAATGVPVSTIRKTAETPVVWIWPRVFAWWVARPDPAAPDDSFSRWWDAYPVTGPE